LISSTTSRDIVKKHYITSVADPDPHVFRPPRSGSGSYSGSGLSKFSKKLDHYSFVTSFGLFFFEKCYKSTFKKECAGKLLVQKFVLVAILKVNDENRKIRIPIRVNKSEAWIPGSGSTPKFHGSATLNITKR
jgi:hypothetical protein